MAAPDQIRERAEVYVVSARLFRLHGQDLYRGTDQAFIKSEQERLDREARDRERFRECRANGGGLECLEHFHNQEIMLGVAGPPAGKVIQWGGRTLTARTIASLNQIAGKSLSPDKWRSAIEALKRFHGVAHNYHGRITDAGEYVTKKGNEVNRKLAGFYSLMETALHEPEEYFHTPYDDDWDTCDRVAVELRIYAPELDPAAVTNGLGISPTESQSRGETFVNSIGRARVASKGGWFLSSERAVNSRDIRVHLDWLIGQIWPRRHKLFTLISEGSYEIWVNCVWWSRYGDGGPTLCPKHMRALSDLNLEIQFDIAFSEPANESDET